MPGASANLFSSWVHAFGSSRHYSVSPGVWKGAGWVLRECWDQLRYAQTDWARLLEIRFTLSHDECFVLLLLFHGIYMYIYYIIYNTYLHIISYWVLSYWVCNFMYKWTMYCLPWKPWWNSKYEGVRVTWLKIKVEVCYAAAAAQRRALLRLAAPSSPPTR